MTEKKESEKVFDAMGFEFPGSFKCKVCNEWRQDEFIDVDMLKIGLSQSNVNYCNDKLSCKNGAQKIQDCNKIWMKKYWKQEKRLDAREQIQVKLRSIIGRFANFFKTLFDF